MSHRIGALTVVVTVGAAGWFAFRHLSGSPILRRLSVTWCFVVLCQVILGAATIWTNKSADIATIHVAMGALSLMNGTMLVLVSSRYLWKESPVIYPVPAKSAISHSEGRLGVPA
jgi:cytochrome c oxidase assembly protein subunit 15